MNNNELKEKLINKVKDFLLGEVDSHSNMDCVSEEDIETLASNFSDELTTLFTEMVEGELRGFRQYVNDQKGFLTNATLDEDLENFIEIRRKEILSSRKPWDTTQERSKDNDTEEKYLR